MQLLTVLGNRRTTQAELDPDEVVSAHEYAELVRWYERAEKQNEALQHTIDHLREDRDLWHERAFVAGWRPAVDEQ